MDLRIRLLSTVEVAINGTFRSPGPGKQQLILASLAWEANRTVRVESLLSRLYDTPTGQPHSVVHSPASRLRRLLEADRSPGAPQLLGKTRAYRLVMDPQGVDVTRFRRALAFARAEAERGRDQTALESLDEASALWGGEPLAGLNGDWPEAVRTDLTERHLSGELLRAAIHMRRERYAEAVVHLNSLCAHHPGHESAVEYLAVALYADDRPIQAARVLREFSHRLVQREGTSPGAQLRRLQDGILNGRDVGELLPRPARLSPLATPATSVPGATAPGAGGRPDSVARPDAPVSAVRPEDGAGPRQVDQFDNLPPEFPCVGRQRELSQLLALADQDDGQHPVASRLAAVHGMAGVGKTALALQAGYQLRGRFPDAQLMIDLRGFAPGIDPLTPEGALAELLRSSGETQDSIPTTREALIRRWRGLMNDRRAVIILDNVRDAEQIQPLLLPRTRGLTVVTSRRRLSGLPNAVPLTLDKLPEGDAIALFEGRLMPDRRPGRHESAQVVRLCGYLPLAVEIVASRFASRPAWQIADLLERLSTPVGDRLAEIRGAGKEITTAFDLSYATLTPRERLVFRRSCLHPGLEFDVHAVAALSGLSVAEADHALEELLISYLVEERTPGRYRLHDLLRSYAHQQLAAEDQPDAIEQARQQLHDYYLMVCDAADRTLFPYRTRIAMSQVPQRHAAALPLWSDPLKAHRWQAEEAENIFAVLEEAATQQPPSRAALYTHVLAGFAEAEQYLTQLLPALQRAVDYWQEAGEANAEVTALIDLGRAHVYRSELQLGLPVLERARARAAAVGDRSSEAEATHFLGVCLLRLGDEDQPMKLQRAVLDTFPRETNLLLTARCLNAIGMIQLRKEDYRAARRTFFEALRLVEQVNEPRFHGRVLNNIGVCFSKTADHTKAEEFHRRSLQTTDQLASRFEQVLPTVLLVKALVNTGRSRESLPVIEEILPKAFFGSDKSAQSMAMTAYGMALLEEGRTDDALRAHRRAVRLVREVSMPATEAAALRELARATAHRGKRSKALRLLRESMRLGQLGNSQWDTRMSEELLHTLSRYDDRLV